MAHWRARSADAEEEIDDPAPEADEAAPEPDGGGKAPKRISREIRIEQVRALGDFVATSTHRGGQRAVMLAPAELLNGPSANALLKMLEEPPPGSLFVLATDALDDVLPTIRSRCVLVRVPAPARAQALAWLTERALDDPEAALAAAGGAPLVALSQHAGDANEPALRSALEPALRAALLELLARGPQLTAAEVAARIPKTVQVPAALALFQRWGWDLLALSAVRSPGSVRYHPRAAAALARVAGASDTGRLLGWLDALARHRARQEHPLNARLVVESALLDYLACFEPGAVRRGAR